MKALTFFVVSLLFLTISLAQENENKFSLKNLDFGVNTALYTSRFSCDISAITNLAVKYNRHTIYVGPIIGNALNFRRTNLNGITFGYAINPFEQCGRVNFKFFSTTNYMRSNYGRSEIWMYQESQFVNTKTIHREFESVIGYQFSVNITKRLSLYQSLGQGYGFDSYKYVFSGGSRSHTYFGGSTMGKLGIEVFF